MESRSNLLRQPVSFSWCTEYVDRIQWRSDSPFGRNRRTNKQQTSKQTNKQTGSPSIEITEYKNQCRKIVLITKCSNGQVSIFDMQAFHDLDEVSPEEATE